MQLVSITHHYAIFRPGDPPPWHEYDRYTSDDCDADLSVPVGGIKLTPVDTASVMGKSYENPCRTGDGGLSSLDRVAAEFAYPKSIQVPMTSDWLAFDGGWVLRTTGQPVTPEAYAHGVLGPVFRNPNWYVDGIYKPLALLELTIANLKRETWQEVLFTFVDPWTRHREATVWTIVSDSKHAAVVMSVMPV